MAGRARRRVAAASGAAQRRHVRTVCRYQAFLHSLLLLHSPVLEPDLHLRFVELQGGSNLDAPRSRQVLVEVKLLLQLSELLVREVGASSIVEAARDTGQRTGDTTHRSAGGASVHR